MSPQRGPSFLATILLLMPATLSAAAHRDVEYARPAGMPQYLDAVIPEGDGPFPAAIIVHGGGWVRGDRRIDVAPLFAPLEAAGIAWFSIDYRLATDITQFGVAIEDIRSAILFVKQHAAQYRIDPERIALVGESAGGQLAAMAALDPSPGGKVKAVVGLYAPTDLVALANSDGLIPKQIRDSLKGTPFERFILARLSQLSPIDHITPDAPPFLLIHGTRDPLVPFAQSVAMCNRMRTAGSACDLYPVDGVGHGVRWWESSDSRITQGYKAEMIRWLKEQLSKSSTLAAR